MKLPLNLVALVSIVLLSIGAVLFSGCRPNPTEKTAIDETPPPPVTLNVVVINDPPLAAAMQRHWSAEGNGEIKLVEYTLDEFSGAVEPIPPTTDVVVFPNDQLADFYSKNRLLPLPSDRLEMANFSKDNLFEHTRSGLIRLQRETMAVPLGSPQFVLLYREDILNQLALDVPQTWEELGKVHSALSVKLAEGALPGIKSVMYEATSGDWAAHSFLARVAARLRTAGRISTVIDMEKGLPLIDREPFLDVLNEMMAQRGGGDDELPLTPEQVYNKAVQGECVFAITWPSSHFKAEPSDATDHLRITRLPGHPQLYDFGSNEWKERDSTAQQRFDYLGFEGRMAGVARHSLHVSEAIRFVGWLSSFPASRKVSIESSHTAPFRTNHLGNITNWTGDAIADRTATEYFDAMTESNRDRLCFIFPRLIEQPKFISVLSDSIRSALSGQATAADALAQAAAEWTVLIEKHSFAEQKKVVLAGENL